MSNLLLLKKNKAKHYRIISNQPFVQNTTEDLLLELKNYRNSKLRQNFTVKNKTPTNKTQRICNSEDLRPTTTGFSTPKISLQESLKRKHTKILESYTQSSNSKPSLGTPDPKFQDFRQFLKTFQYFKSLKIEIELNSELTNAKSPKSSKSKALHSLLLDKMIATNFKVQNSDQISAHLKEFCTIFREILRSLYDKGVEDEILNLEMLWRLILKLIDSSLMLQESTVSGAFEKSEKLTKEMKENCSKKIADMKYSMEEVTKSLRNQIADQANTIVFLKRQNYNIESLVKQKEAEIADLMEPESKDQSCENMRGVIRKLVSFIREAESEQMIQVNALRNLSNVIALAQEINKKPEMNEATVQTEVSLWDIPLPYCELKISNHPFEVFYEDSTVDKKVNKDLFHFCENTLNESEGLFPFSHEVVISLASEFDSKKKLKQSVQQLVSTLSSTQSTEAELFSSLLQLKNPFPPFISNALIQINKNLLPITEGGQIIFSKFLELIQSLFENSSGLIENSLETLNCTNNGVKETRQTTLLARLYLTCSKNKSIENSQDLANIKELKQNIRNLTGWLVSDQDLDYFFQNFDIETDLSTQLAQVGPKVFGMKIEKNQFLLSLGKEIKKKVKNVLEVYKDLWQEDLIDNFVDHVQDFRRDLPEANIKLAYIQKLLKQNPEEILEKTLDYDFANNKVRVSNLLKKKTMSKRGKSKK